ENQSADGRPLPPSRPGRSPREDPPATFKNRSSPPPRALPVSLPADMVRQRPDVRAAEANLHASSAQIGVALANRLPKITLSGNAGSTALAMSKLFTPGTAFSMIAGDAAQVVFDAAALANKQRWPHALFNRPTP